MISMKHAISVLAFLGIFHSTHAHAKGSMTKEMGMNLHYESLKAPTGSLASYSLNGFYLVPAKAIWAGVEFQYGKTSNASYSTKALELGGLIKYWIMDPGDGFAFNFFAGLAVGNENDGFKNYSTLTVKTGPEFAYFVSDSVSISTRIQYAMRKTDTSYTGLSVRSGFSVFL
jgi:hypothetical protein